MKPLDFVAFLFAGFVIFTSIVIAPSQSGDPQIRIKTENALYVFPIDVTETLAIEGPLGTTVVEIADGRVIDPVCEMNVDENNAEYKSEYGGKTYCFCAAGCQKAFDENPSTPTTATNSRRITSVRSSLTRNLESGLDSTTR